MIKKYWALLILILSISACNPVKKILEGGKLQQTSFVEKIPFTFDYGIPFITININGKNYNFMFDTGAATVISPEIAKTLNLASQAEQKVFDSQGDAKAQQFVTIPTIKIGNLDFQDIGAVVIPAMDIFEFKCMKYDGIIGSNLMAKAIWQIDYKNKIITATNDLANFNMPNDAQTIDFVPQAKQLTPLVAVKIGKKAAYATFDTGSNGDFTLGMFTYKTEIENLKSTESVGSTISGIYGSSQSSITKHVKVPILSVGQITLNDQVLDFHQKTSLLVGNRFLKNYKVILNWQENKIYMIKESIYNVPRLETFGFSLKYINNKPTVVKIYKNSEAEKFGVLLGDELISLNGKDLPKLTDAEACFYAFNTILKSEGSSLNLTFLRAGKQLNLTLKNTVILE